jgi:hypothetical protein
MDTQSRNRPDRIATPFGRMCVYADSRDQVTIYTPRRCRDRRAVDIIALSFTRTPQGWQQSGRQNQSVGSTIAKRERIAQIVEQLIPVISAWADRNQAFLSEGARKRIACNVRCEGYAHKAKELLDEASEMLSLAPDAGPGRARSVMRACAESLADAAAELNSLQASLSAQSSVPRSRAA